MRARNIFAKLADEGHDVAALVARGRALDLDPFLTGEEGDEVWGLVMLMARSEETAEQVVRAEEVSLLARHVFAVAQAFHSYYQKPRYTVLRAESEDAARLPRAGGGRLRPPDARPHRAPGHPRPGADVMARVPVGLTIGNSRDAEIFRLRDDYVRAVETAGGLPLVLAPGKPEDAPALAAEYLDRVQALVLSGGADIDPALYGEARHPTVTRVFRERDAFELALCREALRRDMPTLAICRGHQLLNVATGGTLFQDIASQVAGGGRARSRPGALGALPRRGDPARDAAAGDPGHGSGSP